VGSLQTANHPRDQSTRELLYFILLTHAVGGESAQNLLALPPLLCLGLFTGEVQVNTNKYSIRNLPISLGKKRVILVHPNASIPFPLNWISLPLNRPP
jgi:hypothetical protein